MPDLEGRVWEEQESAWGGAGEDWTPAEGIHWVSQMKGGGRVWVLLYVVMALMYQLYVQSLWQMPRRLHRYLSRERRNGDTRARREGRSRTSGDESDAVDWLDRISKSTLGAFGGR